MSRVKGFHKRKRKNKKDKQTTLDKTEKGNNKSKIEVKDQERRV